MRSKTWMAYAVVALVVVLGVGACGGDDDGLASSGGGEAADGVTGASRGAAPAGSADGANSVVLETEGAGYDAPDAAPAELPEDEDAATDDFGAPSQPQSAAALPSLEPHVIKTAAIRIEVAEDGFRDAITKATAIADARGGFVLTSSSKDEKLKRGAVTIRVPAGSFEAALADAEAIGNVTAQSVTGEDVSQEFVDLRSRLRNSEAQEEVLLRLYDRAASVADTIRIQREVQDVQLQIEQMRGRLRFLQDKTSFSTITIELVEEGAAALIEEAEPQGTLERAWDQAVDAFLGVIAAGIVVVGAILPIALLLALVIAGVKVLRPRFTPNV